MESLSLESLYLENIKKGYFNSMNVSKYFNDQKPYDPYVDDMYTDKEFLPHKNTILSIPKYGPCKNKENSKKLNSIIESIEFKRADDIFGKDWDIFQGKLEVDDIKQGKLGNCYFLSAIAALVAKNPNLIYQLFRTRVKKPESEYKNYFEVVLFIDGIWQVIIIDDYFITYKESEKYLQDSEFPFTRPNKKELWVLILEKAWAKISGGYSNSISGSPCGVFKALTGCDTESLFFKCPHDFKKIDEVWEILINSINKGYAICSAPETTKYHNEAIEFGLLFEHVYSLTSAKEGDFDGEKLRLVKIRNPWGNGEWTGKYSDNDNTNWTQEKKSYFGFEEAKDDGSFYMQFEDFYKYWGYFFIGMIKSNAKVKCYSISPMQHPLGSVFTFYFDKKATVNINTKFKNPNSVRGTIVYAKYNEKKEISEVDGFYLTDTEETNTVTLNEGFHVIWIYQHSPNIPVQVTFTIDEDFKVKHVGFDEEFYLIREIIGQGYIQREQTRINAVSYNSYGKNQNFHSYSYQNLWNTGFGFQIFMGKNGVPEENYRLKLICDAKYLYQILPPYNKQLEHEFVYNTVQNKKPLVILGQKHENTDWLLYASEETKLTNDQPTVVDSYEFEKLLSFEFKNDNNSQNYYDYIL